MNIAIIGAGASGVMTALNIKELNSNINVDIYEREDRILKKLAATGGGKCNLGNNDIQPLYFNNEEYINKFINCFDKYSYINYFNKYNLKIINEKNLLYPNAKTTSMVIEFLKHQLTIKKVNVYTNKEIYNIDFKNNIVMNKKYDYIVISIGSKALYNNDVYSLLNKEFKVTKLQQSLVGFKSNQINDMKEIRQSCNVSLIREHKTIYSQFGEVQFKNDGLSGICIMNLSSKYIKGDYLELDLFPNEDTDNIINSIINKNLSTKDCFKFTFDKKILNLIKVDDKKIDDLNKEELINFINKFKKLKITIDGLYDYKFAQVVKGGIDLSEVDMFKSIKYPNIYFTGEILDIDGICGGYNLWFAFNSGMMVGEEICKCV